MASPQSLLPWLMGGAIGAAGVLQGLHWRSTARSGDLELIEQQLQMAAEENELLQRENASLRSLAQGGGEVAVPQELIDRAEKEFELKFLSAPIIHRIASEELRDRIAASYESRFGPAGIDYRQEAYGLIGWINPDDRLLMQLTAVRSVGARSWFDEVSGEGWVTDRWNIENIPDQAAVVRLLARILLHQHFPPPPAYPGDDAARAREALHQGSAAGSEARFYAANARGIGFMPMREDNEAEQLLASLPPFIQGLVTFPVMEGKGLADTLYVQGAEHLQNALRHPPRTTRQVVFPAEPPPTDQQLVVPQLPDDVFLAESAGALGLRLWLEPLGDVGIAAEIASEWQNDHYWLFPEDEARSGLIWEIELESAEATQRLQEVASDLLGALGGADVPVAPGVALVTPEGRHLQLSRPAPNRLRFLNVSRAATVEKFQAEP